METIYRKVETEDRLPTENDQYYTSNGLLDFCIRNGKGDFWDENDDFELYPHYWLEEIPDPTAQLQADKEELLERKKGYVQILQIVLDNPANNLSKSTIDLIGTLIRDLENTKKHKQ